MQPEVMGESREFMSQLTHSVHRLRDLTPSTSPVTCPGHRYSCPLLDLCSWAVELSAVGGALGFHAREPHNLAVRAAHKQAYFTVIVPVHK